MSDQDLLKLAARSLRNSTDGKRPGSGFTRARIMKTLHARRRRRALWWSFTLPVGALLFGGSAWASATDNWPLVWQNVEALVRFETPPLFVSNVEESSAQPHADNNAHNTGQAIPSRLPEPLDGAPEADEVTDPEITQTESADEPTLPPGADPALVVQTPPAAAPARDRRSIANPDPGGPTQVASSDESSAPEPETLQPADETPIEAASDPELAVFRKAHQLHFVQRSPSAALAAYRDYIQRYPSGRFVPEAKYNIGINLLRIGNTEQARQVLQPFAEGRYGDYRQQQARKLLDAL